jgi:hypothetical protein
MTPSTNFDDEYDYEENYNVHRHFDLTYENRMLASSKPKEMKLSVRLAKEAEKEETNTSSSSTRSISSRNGGGDGYAGGSRRPSYEKTTHDMASKKPDYDPITKTYRLDFRGRASMPSTNNMQIADESNNRDVALQLGKMDKHEYALDYSYPFCVLSAFGVALSCLTRN